MLDTPERTAVYTLATPANSTGAIACVQVRAPNAEAMRAFLDAASIDLPIGAPRLRDLLGVDEGLAVLWDDTALDLFPHGGIAIGRRLTQALDALGLRRSDEFVYHESADGIEQRMLTVLAHAPSPLAVDLLLDQPRRWRAHTEGCPIADASVLNRLLEPPLVAAMGPTNIGKSTLLNALAGRSVAIVADEPATTRDHVGATLDLGGLVVRYLDTPGLLPDARGIDARAIEIAQSAIDAADLVLECGDPGSPPIASGHRDALRVCLRADLLATAPPEGGSGTTGWDADVTVSAREGIGVEELVRTIRDSLVPPGVMADPGPWRFWDAMPTRVGDQD